MGDREREGGGRGKEDVREKVGGIGGDMGKEVEGAIWREVGRSTVA